MAVVGSAELTQCGARVLMRDCVVGVYRTRDATRVCEHQLILNQLATHSPTSWEVRGDGARVMALSCQTKMPLNRNRNKDPKASSTDAAMASNTSTKNPTIELLFLVRGLTKNKAVMAKPMRTNTVAKKPNWPCGTGPENGFSSDDDCQTRPASTPMSGSDLMNHYNARMQRRNLRSQ